MLRLLIAFIASLTLLAFSHAVARADDDYTVPIIVGGKSYTLTVTVSSAGISVTAGSPAITVGKIVPVRPVEELTDQENLDVIKASAVTIPYDDLFRYNEKHVGKTVRYVGQVLQAQKNECLFCENPGYVLRIAVSKGSYGLWDDPIWVDYAGSDRFLEDDIVTLWGVVEGLQDYTAVLGNQITIPHITAIDLQLGEVANPQLTPATASASAATSAAGATAPIANRNANLRSGPGTGYTLVGSVALGNPLEVTARNQAGDWLQLANGQWIASFLVDNAPAVADLPVAAEIPRLPTPTPPTSSSSSAAPATTTSPAAASPSVVTVGQEVEAGGWRFKVSELHKRKAVYFYDDPYIAMGRFLIVVIDAVNLQSGTDYFDRNIDPRVVDQSGKVFNMSGSGSGYAQWQLGGLDSLFTSVNPGNGVRIAFAVDLPDSIGNVLLKTDVGKTIDLGNFAAMTSEDN
jgi:hypothetical protein